ncbi:MarR family winged helix-turn-helix transcriptional regulator [Actinacidiphila sp. ITFR-21]|uniref:MarR family winged helix-turn-helix transcriptional regulator n=1 Tax=Actinacidiphila sp. ITFR-21 TaxID=3075199 RepID=UPI00288B7269|nr:MarR family transcriptional regulator [Streptomyces sp. ITFR-21]WNI19269.1 MarR family transcriptional regulator [Streptomyces sp. ITFR-21]
MTGDKDERALVAEWREILAVHARTTGEIDRELHPYGLRASDFEVLDVLVGGGTQDGGSAFRVQELADRVHLSQSALSRLVSRLEKDGLVGRDTCSEDRRGVRVAITAAGRERYEEARPGHLAVLERMLPRG